MAFIKIAAAVLLIAAFASQADAANSCTSCGRPNYGSGGYPATCGGTQYSSSAISSITTQLNTQWPSYTGSNNDFWLHEYNKHGTCAVSAGEFSNQLDYFQSALAVNQQYNLLSALAASGITPSSTKTQCYNQVGADPLIHCSSGKLTEIWQCFDENLNLEDCNTACYGLSCQNNDCSQNTLIPSS